MRIIICNGVQPIVLEETNFKRIIRNWGLFLYGGIVFAGKNMTWVQWFILLLAMLVVVMATISFFYEIYKEGNKPRVIFLLEASLVSATACLILTMLFIQLGVAGPSKVALFYCLYLATAGFIWVRWWCKNTKNSGEEEQWSFVSLSN